MKNVGQMMLKDETHVVLTILKVGTYSKEKN